MPSHQPGTHDEITDYDYRLEAAPPVVLVGSVLFKVFGFKSVC
jgi:hypothetical protein